jgi:hypothetical protein
MNDQQILEQLARHPESRAVQLADRLDVDLEDVQTALAALVAAGDVIASDGTSPAGFPCQLYRLRKGLKLSLPSLPAGTPAPAGKAASDVAPAADEASPIVVPKFLTDGPAPQLSSTNAAPGVYRVGLWSDGILEIQLERETVAEIPKAAGVSIAAWLNWLARADEV